MRSAVAAICLALAIAGVASCQREQKALERDLPAARETKARSDAQQIASAVRLYQATFGALPESLEALTRAQTVGGIAGGPFLRAVPTPPAGWSPYQYTRQPDGARFTVSSSAGALTVTAP
ncbi:MAG TPA: type II secretion system protein GspG [Candidatus Methylomirabilis sp.]|nr:type II secretion system protein GspG [Candidatus Methylomirabilis sp.]